MATLHLIDKSPARSDALAACLRVIAADDALLLIEDGVYAAVAGSTAAATLPGHTTHALGADVSARGLQRRLAREVKVIDESGFVELALHCDRVMSWF